MKYLPEWHKRTPEVLKAISNAYLLSPKDPRSHHSNIHQCTLLGHKVTLDCRVPLVLSVIYKGWDQRERPPYFGEVYGTYQETKIEQIFEIGHPDFVDKLDQFFWDVGLPILYVLDKPNHPKEANTHSYDFEQIREWKDKIPGSEMRPATYEEIRSVPMGCLAIWMNCQIGMYGCERVEDFKGGLWTKIQHMAPVVVWADRQFDNIVCFMRAFLPVEERKVGLTKSRKTTKSHKDGYRSRRNTYSSSGIEESRPSS